MLPTELIKAAASSGTSRSLEKQGGQRTQEVLDALRDVLTRRPTKDHLAGWTRHGALNVGMAVEQAKDALKGTGPRKEALKGTAHSLIFAGLPPTHHTSEEMRDILPHSHREWYRFGAGTGPDPRPKKKH